MTAGDRHPALRTRNVNEYSLALAREWKRLGRAATFRRMVGFAVMASPRADLSDRIEDPELREAEEDRAMSGSSASAPRSCNRSGGGVMDADEDA